MNIFRMFALDELCWLCLMILRTLLDIFRWSSFLFMILWLAVVDRLRRVVEWAVSWELNIPLQRKPQTPEQRTGTAGSQVRSSWLILNDDSDWLIFQRWRPVTRWSTTSSATTASVTTMRLSSPLRLILQSWPAPMKSSASVKDRSVTQLPLITVLCLFFS